MQKQNKVEVDGINENQKIINSKPPSSPIVGIIMGSDSDLPIMKEAADILKYFTIPFEIKIVSAHRTPEKMVSYAKMSLERGLKVIIAGAGGSAHLPGMIASLTPLPVIGVPIKTSINPLNGIDSLFSIVQMPPGIPVATVAINGAKNAGILACSILAITNLAILKKLEKYKNNLSLQVISKNEQLEKIGYENYFKDVQQ